MTLITLLPPSVTVREVAQALAVIHGSPNFEIAPVQNGIGICRIQAGGYHYSYDFEGYNGGRRVTHLPNPMNLCVAMRLVERFGGDTCAEHCGKMFHFRRKSGKKSIKPITKAALRSAKSVLGKLSK